MIRIKMYCRELFAVVLGSKHIRPGIPTATTPQFTLKSIDNYLHTDGHEVSIVRNGLVGVWSK